MSALDISLNTSFVNLSWKRPTPAKPRASQAAVRLPGSRMIDRQTVHPVARMEQALFIILGGGFAVMATSFALQFLR